MRSLLLLAVLVTGCAAKPAAPTIRGADLYDRVGELRTTGRALVPWKSKTVEVRRNQFLIDRSRDQVFAVWDVIQNCRGTGIYDDTSCTLALLTDQRFTVADEPPEHQVKAEAAEISDLDKARLGVAIVGVPMAIGAFQCDAFDGCKEALAVGAGLDALLLLLLYTGLH